VYTFRAIFSGACECYRWGCPAAARPPGSPWGRQARYKRAFHEGVFEKQAKRARAGLFGEVRYRSVAQLPARHQRPGHQLPALHKRLRLIRENPE
jgi:hypothetical protein